MQVRVQPERVPGGVHDHTMPARNPSTSPAAAPMRSETVSQAARQSLPRSFR
jgi:hypothetical protein